MLSYNMLDAKNQLSKLVEAVESGSETEILIARNGKPAVRLVAVEEDQQFGVGAERGDVLDARFAEAFVGSKRGEVTGSWGGGEYRADPADPADHLGTTVTLFVSVATANTDFPSSFTTRFGVFEALM